MSDIIIDMNIMDFNKKYPTNQQVPTFCDMTGILSHKDI